MQSILLSVFYLSNEMEAFDIKKSIMMSCRSAHVRFIWKLPLTLTGMRNLSGTTSLGRRPPGLAVRARLSPPVCGAPAALVHIA